jgi:hypothetical protein
MLTDTPYTKAIQDLNALIEEGRRIAEALAGAKKLKGQADVGAELAKLVGLAKPRTVDKVGSGIKKMADATTDFNAIAIALWFKRVHGVVGELHTGRRNCELSERGKKNVLRSLAKASQSKSLKTILTKSLPIASTLVAKLTVLECAWKPKGKLIPAGRLIKGIEEIESLLAHNCHGYVKLCDAYCSRRTLSVLEATPKALPLTVLTMNVSDENDFTEALSRARQSGRKMSVSVLMTKPGFHDRYIITQGLGWTIGTSVKDIGNRDTLIHEIENRDEVEKMIDDYLGGARGAIRGL